jgi:hypothetical protein
MSGCYSDFDCSLVSACNLALSTPGVCVELMSLKSGEVVSCQSSNFYNNLCQSSACNVTNARTKLGACTEAPKLNSTFPKICTSNADCVGTNSQGKTFTTTCNCGYNLYGHSYCQAFPGDAPWTTFLEVYKTIVQVNSASACHSSNRYSGECLDAIASKANLDSDDLPSVLFYNATNYGDFLTNDECVKATVNSYYWSEHPVPPTPVDPDDHDDDDDVAVLLSTSVAILAYFV